MKIPAFILSLGLAASAFAQIFVTGLDRDGKLAWTNCMVTTAPHYDLLSSTSVTGGWQRVLQVTNLSFATVTNRPPPGGTTFFCLAWVDDAPVSFDYYFDEGYGVPAYEGTLSVRFASPAQAGSWTIYETGLCIDCLHPEGTGNLAVLYATNQVRLFLVRQMDNTVFLDGTIQRSGAGSSARITRYTGTVWSQNFSDTTALGSFLAEARP